MMISLWELAVLPVIRFLESKVPLEKLVQNSGKAQTLQRRIKDAGYAGKAKTTKEYITESILDPSAYVVGDYPDNQMPKDFGLKLTGGALSKIVDYLAALEEGKPLASKRIVFDLQV